jgi:hypothetical protein
MVGGSVVADGSPADVVSDPAVTASYLGASGPDPNNPHPTDDPTGARAGQED